MGLTDFNLTPKAKKGLKDAKKFAEANGHSLVTNAHLVYGCLVNISDSCALKLKSYGISLDAQLFIKTFKDYASQNKDHFQAKKGQGGWHDEVNEVIFFSKEFSDNFGSYFIGVEHILYVILDMGGSFIDHLKKAGIDADYAKDIIETHVLETSIPPTDQIKNILYIEGKKGGSAPQREAVAAPLEHLSKYCVNLNHEFLLNRSSKISGREKETDELIEILSKKNKSNAILVGEAGVGKTAIVEGLAQRIVNQTSPPHMSLMQICAVDISAMIAGTKYRGEFEERFKCLIAEAEKEPNIILFFDEIHTIIGAGNSEGAVDASNMLKPALARGSIKCIGATTSQEYKKFFEKDSAMKRRFDKIVVEEPSRLETKEIITNALPFYEDFHKVKYQERDIDTILDFCEKFLSHKRFPDKAFDIIDQLGAKTKIKYEDTPSQVKHARNEFCEFLEGAGDEKNLNEEKFTEFLKKYLETMAKHGKSKRKKHRVRQKDIVQVMEEKTGLSRQTLSKNTSFSSFFKQMNSEVFGQEKNITTIHNSLSCAKAGLNDSNKPLANFLFIGDTSVGKTFTAKKIAKYFYGNEKAFIQLNMSEYQDKTGISKLLGANAGYVGYEEGGLLTEFVRENPNCVVLFDEIEKCDPKILDVLLHILDEGYATDNLNREIDFTHTVLVMTSNIGQGKKSKRSMGFLPQETAAVESYKDSLKKHLRPELLARIDEILFFNNLEDHHLLKIVNQELFLIQERLATRGIEWSYNTSTSKYIFNQIKQKNTHARDIKNLVKSLIQVPLSQFIVKNRNVEKISAKIIDKTLTFH
jgi:ATP-dependent Clp protease ATP-binding subunit ClpC